jgi:DNA-binding IclR family transcriptional regulator
MTARGDRVLRLLRQVGGASTIAELAERCREALDAAEVRDTLVRLVELGHVMLEGDAARLLPTGWHVGG